MAEEKLAIISSKNTECTECGMGGYINNIHICTKLFDSSYNQFTTLELAFALIELTIEQ